MLPVALSRTFVLGVIFLFTLCSANPLDSQATDSARSATAHRLSRRETLTEKQYLANAQKHYDAAEKHPEKSVEGQQHMIKAEKQMERAHKLVHNAADRDEKEKQKVAVEHYQKLGGLRAQQIENLHKKNSAPAAASPLIRIAADHAYHSTQQKIELANAAFSGRSKMHYGHRQEYLDRADEHKSAINHLEDKNWERAKSPLHKANDNRLPIVPGHVSTKIDKW